MIHVTFSGAQPAAGFDLTDMVFWGDDCLSTGPVPADLPFRELRALRHRFWTEQSEDYYGPVDPTLIAKRERILAQRPPRPIVENQFAKLMEADEIVLWFGP